MHPIYDTKPAKISSYDGRVVIDRDAECGSTRRIEDRLIASLSDRLGMKLDVHDITEIAGILRAESNVLVAPKIMPPRIGANWPGQGGIYAGIMRGENGRPDYHLIVPTHTSASVKEITWGGRGINEPGANSEFDGLANTATLVANIDHPAAQWAAKLSIDGHNDFYLPARRELRLLHANVSDHFETDDWYWSSTRYAALPDSAWCQNFGSGGQDHSDGFYVGWARAVRRINVI